MMPPAPTLLRSPLANPLVLLSFISHYPNEDIQSSRTLFFSFFFFLKVYCIRLKAECNPHPSASREVDSLGASFGHASSLARTNLSIPWTKAGYIQLFHFENSFISLPPYDVNVLSPKKVSYDVTSHEFAKSMQFRRTNLLPSCRCEPLDRTHCRTTLVAVHNVKKRWARHSLSSAQNSQYSDGRQMPHWASLSLVTFGIWHRDQMDLLHYGDTVLMAIYNRQVLFYFFSILSPTLTIVMRYGHCWEKRILYSRLLFRFFYKLVDQSPNGD